MTSQTELQAYFSRYTTAPFLFIGSGIARRYLALDDWEGLLRRFSTFCGKPYEYYLASANGSLPRVASEIAKEFHSIWWNSAEFKLSRDAHTGTATSVESALKIEVSNYVKKQSETLPIDGPLADELDLLRKVVIDGVITTNWDPLLEILFPEFRVFVGQDELLFSAPQGVGEIYKIHGSCTAPNSLVLSQADYDRFSDRNPYLAAKLLAIFVEHPIVFLGYSLSDPNVISILRSISSCLTPENMKKLQERLLFVQWDPALSAPQLSNSTIVSDGHHIPILHLRTSDFSAVYGALSSVKRKFPARLLRQLKEHVYDLVLTSDPNNKLFVQEIDNETELADIEVVFGIGAVEQLQQTGYKGITRNDLLIDVIEDNGKYDAKCVVRDTLPVLFKHAKYVPIYKYLRQAKALDENGKLKVKSIDTRVVRAASFKVSSFNPPAAYMKNAAKYSKISSFKAFAKSSSIQEVLTYTALIPTECIEVDALRLFLRKNIGLLEDDNSFDQTQFIKLVCLYDLLKYGRQ